MASRSRPAERLITHVTTTAAAPPRNAATGRSCCPASARGRYEIAIVAPRPAPAATPRRYGIGERVVEDALVGRARDGEHAAHERGEHDPGDSELPEDRLLRRVERRRIHQPEPSEKRADGIADSDVERAGEDPDDDRDDEEGGRRQRPRG